MIRAVRAIHWESLLGLTVSPLRFSAPAAGRHAWTKQDAGAPGLVVLRRICKTRIEHVAILVQPETWRNTDVAGELLQEVRLRRQRFAGSQAFADCRRRMTAN
jgi:hypothetical protein